VPEVVDRAASGAVAIRSAIRCVERYLRGMDEAKAWTFVLHDVHGYDLEEVSSITGVSRAAAQSRLVRGRKALHERIAKDPELASLFADLARREEA
jgi:RNA polymerase sigma-70 factor (ECF subfamily)